MLELLQGTTRGTAGSFVNICVHDPLHGFQKYCVMTTGSFFFNFCGRVVKRNMIFAAILLTRRGTWCDFNSLRLANYVKYTNRSKTRVENTFMLPVKKCDAHKVTALLLYRYHCKAKNTFLLKVKQLYNLLSTWNIEPLPCVRIEYLFMLPEKVFSKNVHPFLYFC